MIFFCVLVGLLLAGSYCRGEVSGEQLLLRMLNILTARLENELEYGGKQYQSLGYLNSEPSSSVIVNYSYILRGSAYNTGADLGYSEGGG